MVICTLEVGPQTQFVFHEQYLPPFPRHRLVPKYISPSNNTAEPSNPPLHSLRILSSTLCQWERGWANETSPPQKVVEPLPSGLLVRTRRSILESKPRRGSEFGGGLSTVVAGRKSYGIGCCAYGIRMPLPTFEFSQVWVFTIIEWEWWPWFG